MTKKTIAIFNSSSDIFSTLNFFEELNNKNFSFVLFSRDKNLKKSFREKNWVSKSFFCLLGDNTSLFGKFIFAIFYPIITVSALLPLVYIKYRTDYILCFDIFEKLALTPISKILKIKILWVECPGKEYSKYGKILKFLIRLNSKNIKIITIISLTKNNLSEMGIKREQIKVITPGIKLNNYNHQDNIFSKLAEKDHLNSKRKYFTVGTSLDLDENQNLEILFSAIKKCQTVIPNIQLIIVGEGNERKNLTWLAKKMEIGNLVWFVGEQKYLRKWFDNFDIFTINKKIIKLKDVNIITNALNASLPIIGPAGLGLEDIIKNNENGYLINNDDSESLAEKIILLNHDKRLRSLYKKRSKELVDKYHNIDIMTNQFISVLEK